MQCAVTEMIRSRAPPCGSSPPEVVPAGRELRVRLHAESSAVRIRPDPLLRPLIAQHDPGSVSCHTGWLSDDGHRPITRSPRPGCCQVLVAHQPAHLPWPGYFSRLLDADQFVLLDHVLFSKAAGRTATTYARPAAEGCGARCWYATEPGSRSAPCMSPTTAGAPDTGGALVDSYSHAPRTVAVRPAGPAGRRVDVRLGRLCGRRARAVGTAVSYVNACRPGTLGIRGHRLQLRVLAPCCG